MKVPDVERCCFCLPLRPGIIIFGYINIMLLLVAMTCLAITSEIERLSITKDFSVEEVTSTVLFSILGMGVILNILLIFAGHQKDIQMLRLYNYYAVATTFAALLPTFFLFYRKMFNEVIAALLAVAMQCYVILLVRSEIVKLEKQLIQATEGPSTSFQDPNESSDSVTLL